MRAIVEGAIGPLRAQSRAMPAFSRRHLIVLALLTTVWGLNWPVLKIGVTGFPPLTFRVASLWLSLPVYALVLVQQGSSFVIERRYWRRMALLALFNMALWNALMILAIALLSSGRAAILCYTMPIFSAVIGQLAFHDRLSGRGWLGVAAAAAGVTLLLWNEMARFSGSASGVALMLGAAFSWALGTQLLRRSTLPVPLLALTFWMTLAGLVAITPLAWWLEHRQWHLPGMATTLAMAYNAVLALGFAQAAWFFLARTLPPIASTLSVMMIPVIGVFAGSGWLGEPLHWQDFTAMALILMAIASVLWPARAMTK